MARIVRIHQTGGPEVLRIEEVPVPPPGPGEVGIRIKALGLNRAETMFRSGRYLEDPVFPARLGYEAAGIVEAVGPGVAGLAVGDAVSVVPPLSITRWGAYGEAGNFPAECVVRHPPALSFVEAAAVWMQYVTAYGALIDLARLKAGETVLITAASSSVGLAAIQIANMVGAVPVAVTRGPDKVAALQAAGAAQVIVTDREAVAARVADITGGRGARVVFDPIAGPGLADLVDALAEGGIVIEYGALSPDPTPFPLFPVLAKTATLRGYLYKEIVGDPARLSAAKEFIIGGLARGALKPIIARVFAFDEIVAATRYLEANRQIGKIVVEV